MLLAKVLLVLLLAGCHHQCVHESVRSECLQLMSTADGVQQNKDKQAGHDGNHELCLPAYRLQMLA